MALHQLVLFFLFLHCGLSDYWSSIRMLSVQNGQPAIIPCLYEKEHKDDTKLWCRKDDLSKCAPAVNSTQSQRPAGVSISDDITHGIFTVNMTNISRTDSGYHCCTVKPRTEPPITKDCTNIKVQDHPVLIVDNAMISGNESGTASFSFQYRYSGTSQMFCQLRGECVVSSATDPGSLNGMSVMLSNVARRVTLNGLQRKNTGWYVLSIWPYQIPVHLNVIGIEPTPVLDVVAKWPGSTHDSRLLMESGLRELFERRHVPAGCHLLGDSGYPCKSWLLTPYLHPQVGPQLNYNRAHKKTRSVVERGIGQLKRRFHVLHSEIRLSPEKASQVITVCALLHNLCQQRNIPQPGDGDEFEEDNDDNDNDENHFFDGVEQCGLPFRDHFVHTHFGGDGHAPAAELRGEAGDAIGIVEEEPGRGRGAARRGGVRGRGAVRGRRGAVRGRRGSPETNTNTTASNPDHHGMVEVLVPVCIAVLIVLCAVVGLVRWRRGKRKPPQQAAADANSACETIRLDETRRKVSPKHVVSADAVYVNDMRWERSPKQALKVSAARNLYTEVRV
ncbi:uncharacterized protein LOC134088254 isoform X1 [Sardina pilchardus]|uniref:uncharacterized protein LOC134088254 isoform X1 n=1 Tax=Sardina pilchardus TaxID=27697 RepID=UPI002E106D79